jgi:hypothetical protein
MKIYKNNNNTIIIASANAGGGTCPNVIISSNTLRFRDDYYNQVKLSKNISKKLFR